MLSLHNVRRAGCVVAHDPVRTLEVERLRDQLGIVRKIRNLPADDELRNSCSVEGGSDE